VIVWLGGRELSDDLVDQIVRRVRQGAGLWITLDSQTDRDWLNETLLRTGLVPAATGSKQSDAGPLDAGPLVAGPLGRLVVNVAEDSMQRLHPPDPNDEILAPLSDTDRLDLDAIRIRRRIDLQLPPTETASRVLLRTFEGDSIAWMSSVGRGRLVLQALPMNPSWSNFPLSKAYVVWVLQILDQLSEPVARNFNLVTEQMFRADVESIDHEYEMEFPNKTIEDVFALPKLESVSGVVRFDQTDQPGIYRLHDRDDPSSKPVVFSVASDPSESDISSDVLARLQSIADDSRVRIHDGSDRIDFAGLIAELPTDVSVADTGQPIWPALLVGLLSAIALETFLAGYAALRRYGGLTSRATAVPPAANAPSDVAVASSSMRKVGV
jgi:hypothetical protein